MKKITIILLATLLVFTGCGKKQATIQEGQGETGSDKKTIYTSVYPVYDFTKKIVGDKFNVELIVPVGQEPHDYELDTNVLKGMENADIFVYNGAGLESFADKIIGAIDNKDLVAVEASRGVDLIKADNHEDEDHDHEEEEEEHHHGAYDPHTWLDPENAIIEMENIKNAVVEIDPDNGDFYEENFNTYKAKLEELDKKYQEELKDYKGGKIVVSHEAFGYLCRRYGLEQLGISGINAEGEPDAKTMAEIVDFVKENNIKVIFTEELLDTKVSDTIAAETGAKTLVLNPIEGLSQEELDSGEDYISVMEKNLSNLLEAFK
ncbi:metal ABC transporter substrate-binding protein [Peptoniphilus catoniae]|uniref:metal ABC transporter substrate-binding protein n=1 Tax=Peptoniphilus catoniae TaxID=1660341 RepID=UPI0010FDEE4E|nr:metal ABC transporter substrate-binding protein [Peptoniphilus catoniae]